MSEHAPQTQHGTATGRSDSGAQNRVNRPNPAGAGGLSKHEELQALLKLSDLDSQLHGEELKLERLVVLVADQRASLEDLRQSVRADRERLERPGNSSSEAELLRHRIAGTDASRADLAGEFGQKEAEALALSEMLQRRHAEGDAQRKALTRGMPPEVLALYDLAVRSGRQPFVAKMVSGICSGCYLRVATNLAQRVRSGRHVSACPHCHRLLYEVAVTGDGQGQPRK